MNKNKSQLTRYLKTPNNLIIITNDGVLKGRSLASSVVGSLRPFRDAVGFIALRLIRPLRCVRCVGWKLRFIDYRKKAAELVPAAGCAVRTCISQV